MLGALVGDIVGSIYEWNNHRSKEFPFFGPGADFTDDSVLTMAVADALLHGHPPQKSLFFWATRHPKRGYGGSFSRWLGTWVTEVTHDHPEGMYGARATAHATFLARVGAGADEIRRTISETYAYDMDRTVDSIRPHYTFNESCQETVPEALICALEATSFEDAIRNAISIGGDSDTVAAIADPVAEARFGIPDELGVWVGQQLARHRLAQNVTREDLADRFEPFLALAAPRTLDEIRSAIADFPRFAKVADVPRAASGPIAKALGVAQPRPRRSRRILPDN